MMSRFSEMDSCELLADALRDPLEVRVDALEAVLDGGRQLKVIVEDGLLEVRVVGVEEGFRRRQLLPHGGDGVALVCDLLHADLLPRLDVVEVVRMIRNMPLDVLKIEENLENVLPEHAELRCVLCLALLASRPCRGARDRGRAVRGSLHRWRNASG